MDRMMELAEQLRVVLHPAGEAGLTLSQRIEQRILLNPHMSRFEVVSIIGAELETRRESVLQLLQQIDSVKQQCCRELDSSMASELGQLDATTSGTDAQARILGEMEKLHKDEVARSIEAGMKMDQLHQILRGLVERRGVQPPAESVEFTNRA